MRSQYDRLSKATAYLGGALLGTAAFFWIYSWSYLIGAAPFFDPPRGDVAQALVGLNYFLADSWHWLPLKVPQIHPPEGLSIIYTDSIPLLAILVKLFIRAGSKAVNYFGAWLFTCFVLQGVGAVYLLRSFGERRLFALLLGCVLFLLTETFIWRQVAEHFALCSHFLLLFALGLAVRVVRDGKHWFRRASAFVLLTAASALIHPYMGAMVGGCGAMAALSLAIDRRRYGAALAGFSAMIIVPAAVIVALGFNDAGDRGGFGYFSLNLLAPFWPEQSGIFGNIVPAVDATGGQAEGYAYLGAGMLAIVFIAVAVVVVKRPEFRVPLRAGFALILGMAVAYLYAASSIAYAGPFKLYDFVDVPQFLQTFRSSGRFVWLPIYLGSAAAIVAVVRSFKPVAAAAILTAAVALQAIDISPLTALATGKAQSEKAWSIDERAWDSLLAAHTRLDVLPNYWCGMPSFDDGFLELSYLASRHNIPINQARSGRRPVDADCRSDILALRQLTLTRGQLVVIPSSALSAVLLADIGSRHPQCRAFNSGYACTLAWDAITDRDVQAAFKVAPPPMPPGYARGGRISYAQDSSDAQTRLYGWAMPEPFGTWSVGERAVLLIPVDEVNRPQALTFEASSFGAQRVRITVGQGGGRDYALDPIPRRLTIPLKAEDVVGGVVEVTFETPEAKSPASVGESLDSRILGVALRSIAFD
jgi:hypothetical protein